MPHLAKNPSKLSIFEQKLNKNATFSKRLIKVVRFSSNTE